VIDGTARGKGSTDVATCPGWCDAASRRLLGAGHLGPFWQATAAGGTDIAATHAAGGAGAAASAWDLFNDPRSRARDEFQRRLSGASTILLNQSEPRSTTATRRAALTRSADPAELFRCCQTKQKRSPT